MVERDNAQFHNNSLTLVRYFAAFEVMFSHICADFGLQINGTFMRVLGACRGVPIFFGLSGFLIWHSLQRDDSFLGYVQKRIFRIFPELWLSVIASAICIMTLYGKALNTKDFIAFLFCQSWFMQFWTPDSLRGYGLGAPNGSLWTIPIFIQFYVFAYLMKRYLYRRNKWFWGLLLLACAALTIVSPFSESFFPAIIFKLYRETLIPWLFYFFFGCFISEYWSTVRKWIISTWYLGAVIYALIISGALPDAPGFYGFTFYIAIIWLWIGFAYAFPFLQIKLDLSYGIYLFHGVVINALIEMQLLDGQYKAIPIVIISSIILAYISNMVVKRLYEK